MIPYLHLGPLSLPTFGLMVATGLLVASYVLQADFRRRGIRADAFLIIGIAGLAGIVGAQKSPRSHFWTPAVPLPLWGTPSAESAACLVVMAITEFPPIFHGG